MINGRDEEMTTDFLTHLFKDTSTKKLTYPLKIDGWMNKFGGTCWFWGVGFLEDLFQKIIRSLYIISHQGHLGKSPRHRFQRQGAQGRWERSTFLAFLSGGTFWRFIFCWVENFLPWSLWKAQFPCSQSNHATQVPSSLCVPECTWNPKSYRLPSSAASSSWISSSPLEKTTSA